MALNRLRHAAAGALLQGSSVATLLLFPLLNGLSSQPIWLHWTRYDSLETLCAWLLGTLVVSATLAIPSALGVRRLRDAIGATWLLAGSLFVFAAFAKVDALAKYAATYRSHAFQGVALAMATVALLMAAAITRPGAGVRSRIERTMSVLWPLTALMLFHLVRAPGLAEEQEGVPPSSAIVVAKAPVSQSSQRPLRTIALLLDEMSYDYLFGDRAIDLSALPSLHRLRLEGEIHRDAHLTGGATAIAIPALFGPVPEAPLGLVPELRARGRSVRIWGWYHDYCRTFAREADVCHSTSIYNVRTLDDTFSLLDPWWTDLNTLPAERPFDILKVPFAVAFHRKTLQAARRWLQAQLADPASDFVYAHLNVPHLPLLAPAERPFAFDGYLSQFAYIDDLLGVAMADRTRPSQLIVLSDHNARPLFPKRLHDHVVYARWREGVPASAVETSEDAARLLARMSLNDAQALAAH